jgi:hypothetical protein
MKPLQYNRFSGGRVIVSIGLCLLAKFSSPVQDPDRILQQMAAWIHQNYSDVLPQTRQGFVETYPTLFCQLHPAAEEVELSLIDLEHLRASAKTSTVGPGFHIFVCSMLQAWARDFHASWLTSDETPDDYLDEAEYFFTDNKDRVYEHMTSWLRSLADVFFNGALELGDHGNPLCMPTNIQFESDHLAITALGPRDRTWLLETSQDGAKGRDFFAWWTPELSAEYFLRRALTQMWADVRWRRPVNDRERSILQNVASSLHTAYALDASLCYPWPEWAEALELLDSEEEEQSWVRSQSKGQPTIGYRRHNVTVTLPGGWRMRLPGSFSDFDSGEDDALYALDPPREIWFTAYRSTAGSSDQTFESKRQQILLSRPELLHEGKSFIAKAAIQEKVRESGERYFVLSSSNVCPAKRAICTIFFEAPDDREWAIEVWKSLQP